MPTGLVEAYRRTLTAHERALLLALIRYTRRTLDPTAVDAAWAAWSTGASLLLAAAQDQAFEAGLAYFTNSTIKATGGLPSVVLARPEPDLARLLASLRITGPITIKQAAASGLDPDAALAQSLARTGRFGTSVIGDRAADTVWTGMSAEPACIGYRRVISPGACRRCLQISTTRLFSVEPSRSSRGLPAGYFARHPHCHCTAEPVYRTDTGRAQGKTPRVVPLDLVSERAPLLT